MQLVLIEIANGKIKKASIEAAGFASALGETTALALGAADAAELSRLGQYGIKTVLHIADAKLNSVYSKAYTKALVEAAGQTGAETIILAHNSTGKMAKNSGANKRRALNPIKRLFFCFIAPTPFTNIYRSAQRIGAKINTLFFR